MNYVPPLLLAAMLLTQFLVLVISYIDNKRMNRLAQMAEATAILLGDLDERLKNLEDKPK